MRAYRRLGLTALATAALLVAATSASCGGDSDKNKAAGSGQGKLSGPLQPTWPGRTR